MLATVYLSLAVLCAPTCEPVLVGKQTPVGRYPLVLATTSQPGFGGTVLAYAQSDRYTLSVHRRYAPQREKRERLAAGPAAGRRYVTAGGCIDVYPWTFDRLVREGYNELEIKP